MKSWGVAACAALALGGCDLAPPYKPPVLDLPAHFKENAVWRPARPADRQSHGAWWTGFHDRVLDRLEARIGPGEAGPGGESAGGSGNFDLAVAESNYLQARQTVAEAQSALFPTIGAVGDFSTNRQSNHRPLRSATQPSHYGDNTLDAQGSYEIDLWGRVRDTISATKASVEAQGADLESVRLSIQAELARDYVALRGYDQQLKLLRDTQKAYEDALGLTQRRLEGKIAPPSDVARAEAELATARAAIDDVQARRTLMEHAIATLIGQPASTFSIPPDRGGIQLPRKPAAVPSTLLERRPDIAAAEREVAAANERIGIAKSAFYPRFFLNFKIGSQDTGLRLFDISNEIFALGPSVTLPVYDGGLREAEYRIALEAQKGASAFYKGRIIRAIQEVEDGLALERFLDREEKQADEAAKATSKVLNLTLALYRDGATNYLDVVTAQEADLAAQRTILDLRTRRLAAAVNLYLALGGDFVAPEPVIPAPTGPDKLPSPILPPFLPPFLQPAPVQQSDNT